MPVVNVGVERLSQRLGQTVEADALVDHLEDLGCDVDGTAEIVLAACPACGATCEGLEAPKRCAFCGHQADEPFAETGRHAVIRLDLLADRPDLFDPAGLARALKGLLGIEAGLPDYATRASRFTVEVDPALSEASSYRPFIACAAAEVPPVTEEDLRDLMKLQENLHWALGRDRKLASIGVYDAANLTDTIRYRAVAPDALTFCPLGCPEQPMTPAQILSDHPKGTAYAHLLADHTSYPLLIDAADQVLSLPPIINSEETRVREGTTQLFIDVTGITAADVERSLAVLACSIAEMGGALQSVAIRRGDASASTPDLAPREIDVDLAACNRWLGLDLDEAGLIERTGRMRLDARPAGDDGVYTLRYSAFRSDVKHPVDLYEDVAIAHGYRNFDMALVPTVTVGRERPEEVLATRARAALLGLGFDEAMTMYQTTAALHFERMQREVQPHVELSNPKAAEYRVIRTDLLPGLLELLEKNRRKPAPLCLFEVSNVVHLDESTETGTREHRRVAFAVLGPHAGYAEARAALDALLHELGWTAEYAATEHRSYLPGRVAQLSLAGGEDGLMGVIGELHPQVLLAFHLPYPVAAVELDLCRVV